MDNNEQFLAQEASYQSLNREYNKVLEENEQLKAELERIKATCSLTGLVSRHRMMQEIKHHCTIVERDINIATSHFSIVFIDLDNFKPFNDQSHLLGDRLLQAFASLLQVYTRKSDIVARFGGDEFFILAPNTTKTQAEHFCKRIVTALDQYDFSNSDEIRRNDFGLNGWELQGIHLHASFGVVDTLDDADLVTEENSINPNLLIAVADQRMRKEKLRKKGL